MAAADDDLDSFHLDIEHDIEQVPMRKDEADMNMPPFNLLQQEDTLAPSKMSSNQHKKRKKRRSISDDDDDEATATFQSAIPITDLDFTINQALEEKRIDQAKADRLHECLQAGDWSEIALSLLTEQIPRKRPGVGYTCRVCQVPKKGHTCQYCEICSTSQNRIKKDNDHVCCNCPTCYKIGKKNKKLVQVKSEGHICPHESKVSKNVSV